MDENGYPLNEDYLREQGLNLVDLNREYVTQQEQLAALTEVLADPTQRAEFLAALDSNGNTNNVNNDPNAAPAQRQSFPGGAPGQQQGQPSLEDYYNQLRQASAAGNPLDNLGQVGAAFDSIPDEAYRALAMTLIQGDY